MRECRASGYPGSVASAQHLQICRCICNASNLPHSGNRPELCCPQIPDLFPSGACTCLDGSKVFLQSRQTRDKTSFWHPRSKMADNQPENENTTKTIVLVGHGGYDKLKIQQKERPNPGKGEVQINVKAAGLNFAELACRQGEEVECAPAQDSFVLACSRFKHSVFSFVGKDNMKSFRGSRPWPLLV